MADLRPFRAVRYDRARVGDPAAVVAPPYDIISGEQRRRLLERSPYNVIRLILNPEADPHAAAARELRRWREAGILVQDRDPAFYFYAETFMTSMPSGGGRQRRDGIIGVMRLEDFASGWVRPHERTFEGPKADRLGLIRACRANLSPIFGLVSSPGLVLSELAAPALQAPAEVDITDEDGVRHQLWRMADPAPGARWMEAMREEPIVIADGHHRYETALAFRDEMRKAAPDAGRDAAFEFVLACITNAEEPGVVVLPTHRVLPAARPRDVGDALAALGEIFAATSYRASGRARFLAELDGGGARIGCALPDTLIVLTLRADPARVLLARRPAVRGQAVVLLHDLILPRLTPGPIEFTHDDADALDAVSSGRAGAAFLVRAPTAKELRAVCLAGETLPEKSTYFYPKLLTGLVFHSLEA
jgi:uncharacterized protein (DUF1015 family)